MEPVTTTILAAFITTCQLISTYPYTKDCFVHSHPVKGGMVDCALMLKARVVDIDNSWPRDAHSLRVGDAVVLQGGFCTSLTHPLNAYPLDFDWEKNPLRPGEVGPKGRPSRMSPPKQRPWQWMSADKERT